MNNQIQRREIRKCPTRDAGHLKCASLLSPRNACINISHTAASPREASYSGTETLPYAHPTHVNAWRESQVPRRGVSPENPNRPPRRALATVLISHRVEEWPWRCERQRLLTPSPMIPTWRLTSAASVWLSWNSTHPK